MDDSNTGRAWRGADACAVSASPSGTTSGCVPEPQPMQCHPPGALRPLITPESPWSSFGAEVSELSHSSHGPCPPSATNHCFWVTGQNVVPFCPLDLAKEMNQSCTERGHFLIMAHSETAPSLEQGPGCQRAPPAPHWRDSGAFCCCSSPSTWPPPLGPLPAPAGLGDSSPGKPGMVPVLGRTTTMAVHARIESDTIY